MVLSSGGIAQISQNTTVTKHVPLSEPDAPGGTDDGGVDLKGAGLTASTGDGGVQAAGGTNSPGSIETPDNFDPTLNGPGLTAPGVYAAGAHNTGSKAAASVPSSTAPPRSSKAHILLRAIPPVRRAGPRIASPE